MKNLSLKQKLTILYTVLMTVNICAVLAVLFSLSNREILSSVQNRLRESVTGAFDDIDWADGRLDFDSDILELENGVYLSVSDMDGALLYGKIHYGYLYGKSYTEVKAKGLNLDMSRGKPSKKQLELAMDMLEELKKMCIRDSP